MKINLHKVYYILAIIDIITIILTLFLAYNIYTIYDSSYVINQQWVKRSLEYDRLTDLAIEANAPGNDVFKTKNVPLESTRFNEITSKIHILEANLKNDAHKNLSSYPKIGEKLQKFSSLILQANIITRDIFNKVANRNITEAAVLMAEMDSKFHMALLEASQLRAIIRNTQSEQLDYYHEKAKSIFYKEIYIAIFIFILVGIMLLFGRKVKRKFDALVASLDEKNNQLQEKEKKLSAVLDNILEAIILINEQGIIEYANNQAKDIFQYDTKELIGKNVKMLMPKPYNEHHDEYIQHYLKTRQPKVIGIGREVEGLKKDQTIFPINLAISEIELNNKTRKFVGVLKDITEQKRAELYLSSVSDIQKLYITGVSHQKLFDTILKFLLNYTESEYGFIGSILYAGDNTPYLKTYAITNIAWNEETRNFYDTNAPDGLEFRNLNTLFGHTVKTGEVVLSNDPKTDPRAGGLPKGHPAMHCYLGMPIHANNGLIAMYGLANRKGGYNNTIVKDLETITTVIASIIESSRYATLIEKMANIDPLTEAYNRFYFKTRLSELIDMKASSKNASEFALIMIDMNKFKHINDYYGHEYGDYILKEFVQRIKKHIKSHDLLTRIGGDEFVLIIDNIKNSLDAGKIARRITSLSKEPYKLNDKEITCEASLGITCYPESGTDLDTLLRHADLALYRAKSSPDNYAYFSDKLQKEYVNRQNLEHEILKAFDNDEFYLVFQPIVELKNKKIIGAEALLRWDLPQYLEKSPKSFIEIIESMGLAGRLNLYVVRKCLNYFSTIENINNNFIVSINISPHTFELDTNIKELTNLFVQYTFPKNLTFNLELTETSFMESNVDVSKTSNIMQLLSNQKIGLYLDDFGVEYSSITRLLDAEFTAIKIDMSFVKKLDSHQKEAAKTTIDSIINLALGLDITVIAEGIETETQKDCLIELGCTYGQGYYFYKPMKLDSLAKICGFKIN